jgi:hypothetical protein
VGPLAAMATTLLLRRVPVLAHAVAAILSSSPNPPIALPHSVAHRHIFQVTRRPTLSSSLGIRGEAARSSGCAARSVHQHHATSPGRERGGVANRKRPSPCTANDFHDVMVHQYNGRASMRASAIGCMYRGTAASRVLGKSHTSQSRGRLASKCLPKQGQSSKSR